MAEISCILATVGYSDEEFEEIRREAGPGVEIVRARPKESAQIDSALERADVAILASDLDDRFLKAPRLRWVHCDHAGLNKSARPEVFARGLLVSGSAGRSAPALAEHAFFFMLNLTYRFSEVYAAQRDHRWGVPALHDARALHGKTLGVLGLGNTGRELAVRAAAFGMRVLAYRRREGEPAPGVSRIYSSDAGDTIDPILKESDIIVACVPLSDATYHMIGAREISLLKPTACIINMARGAVIDEAALLAALQAGRIAGAGLDTTDPEPLPAESPLWDAPNVLITPHTTPRVPDRTERSVQIICENMRRYRAGRPLLNQLTPEDIFTKA